MTSPNKRRHLDIRKLKMKNYQIEMEDDTGSTFYVDFEGPRETAYEGGKWQIRISLPAQYPFRSPSVGFRNRIFHPNVDFRSGTICLDVINQTWSPMYDLINIMEIFLPQLLTYPNPADPLNNEAACLMLENEASYFQKVKEYVQTYAKSHCKQETASTQDLKSDASANLVASSHVSAVTIGNPSSLVNEPSSMLTVQSGVTMMTEDVSAGILKEGNDNQDAMSEASAEANFDLSKEFDLNI